jgi:hypothetical protein
MTKKPKHLSIDHRNILIAILAVSVLLRIGCALYLGNEVVNPPNLNDQLSYHTLATRVLAGHGFSFPIGWYPAADANQPTAFWSFGYVLYLAAIYTVFGVQPLVARLIGATLGGIFLPLIVYYFSTTLFRSAAFQPRLRERGFLAEQLALVAAGISAVYFYFILYAATLMTETFYVIALLWSLLLTMRLAERPTLQRGLWLGLSLGLTTLLRQSILPWLVVAVLWLLLAAIRAKALRRMASALIAAGAVMALLIAPFTIRNYSVYGQFLLLNSNAGYAMYSAQHPMQGTDFQEFAAAPIPEGIIDLNEPQMDRELMQRAIGFVTADPGRYVLLSLSRIPDYFEFWPTADSSLVNNLGRVGSFGLMLPFFIYGLVLAVHWAGPAAQRGWGAFSTSPLALVLLFMLCYSILHILTWAMPRYRLPVDAVALPLAALALTQSVRFVTTRWRARRAQPAVVR